MLCRLALGGGAIDAASFSTLRLVSGALTLWLIATVVARVGGASGGGSAGGSWAGAALLFLYAIPFSFAYLSLSAGTGALILFGAVQVTMIGVGLRGGERPDPRQWLGLAAASGGLVYLVLPGLDAPAPAGSALMALAGVAWGLYSLAGRGAADPLAATTGNFVRAAPLAAAVSAVAVGRFHLTGGGAVLAVASGALASGLGYVVWYAALRGLTATRAATVQLAVPILAAAGGALFLAETVTARLVVAAALVLGGVALALSGRVDRVA